MAIVDSMHNWDQELFDKQFQTALERKDRVAQQAADARTAEVAGQNKMYEDRFGSGRYDPNTGSYTGGVEERIARMQFGVGGAADRKLDVEREHVAAIRPYYSGTGAFNQAQADAVRKLLPYAENEKKYGVQRSYLDTADKWNRYVNAYFPGGANPITGETSNTATNTATPKPNLYQELYDKEFEGELTDSLKKQKYYTVTPGNISIPFMNTGNVAMPLQ